MNLKCRTSSLQDYSPNSNLYNNQVSNQIPIVFPILLTYFSPPNVLDEFHVKKEFSRLPNSYNLSNILLRENKSRKIIRKRKEKDLFSLHNTGTKVIMAL